MAKVKTHPFVSYLNQLGEPRFDSRAVYSIFDASRLIVSRGQVFADTVFIIILIRRS